MERKALIFDPTLLDKFPEQPGVYLMKDAKDQVLYIGKANQLKNRLKQYFIKGRDTRAMVPFLVQEIAYIDTIVVPSEKEALLLESTLIKRHQPKYNACLKDDKTFISLMINTSHSWPMLRLVRYKQMPKDKGLYFGPYTSAYAAREIFDLLNRLFPLRQCSDEELKRRTRPCLLYSIKRCVAPCVKKCTPIEYASLVQQTIQFLKGQDKKILNDLYERMHQASDQMEYEKASAILQTIRQIEHVIAKNSLVHQVTGKNTDVLALYREAEEVMLVQLKLREGKLIGSEHYEFSHILQTDEEIFSSFLLQHYLAQEKFPEEILFPSFLPPFPLVKEILCDQHSQKISFLFPQKGEKKALVDMAKENARAIFQQKKDHRELKEKMLLDLQETLKLNRYPRRIICFDTSHIAGSDPVACLIAFTDGIKDSKRTRFFRIKTAKYADDYGAMQEAIKRTLVKAKDQDDLPDLIIVDGGKGQLNAAASVLSELNIVSIDLIGLTKEEGRHDKGMTQEKIFLLGSHDPIHLNPRSNLLFFLQKIRDETHRQALLFHQKRRKKRLINSQLDEIQGIGPIKRKRLLRHFKSVENIRQATDEELKAIQGISKKDIQAIRQRIGGV